MNCKRFIENGSAVSKVLLLEKYQERNDFAPKKNSYEIF